MVASDPTQEVIGGRYALERRLGRGGVGEVFLANDMQLNRWVAIKRLHADTEEAARRAELAMQEAKSLASLQHPNIVTLYDFVRQEEEVCVVMEFVQGRTLESIAASAPLVFTDFVQVSRQSLEGLGAAHHLGMIHRDIKPSNLMIADLPGGKFQVKILDFGLAKIISEPSLQTLDQSGSLLGSIYTMAPEQLEHRELDQRTDLYSLGCVLYYALTTRNPFEGDTIATVITSHLQHSFEPLAPLRPDLPPEVCEWVQRLFSREMADRPETASAAASDLDSLIGETTGFTNQFRPAKAKGTKPQGTKPAFVPATTSRGKPAVAGPAISTPATKNFLSMPVLVGAGVGIVVLLAAGGLLLNANSEKPAKSLLPGTVSGAPESLAASAVTSPARPTAPTPAPTQSQASLPELAPQNRSAFLAALGKEVVVNGTIGRFGENKTGTIRFLNFMGTQRGDLSLVFFVEDDPTTFSQENLESFIGRPVSVRGTVSEYAGTPQIEIRDMNQITMR